MICPLPKSSSLTRATRTSSPEASSGSTNGIGGGGSEIGLGVEEVVAGFAMVDDFGLGFDEVFVLLFAFGLAAGGVVGAAVFVFAALIAAWALVTSALGGRA